jgi:hypothetical protein
LTDKFEDDVVRNSGEQGKVLSLELTVVTEVKSSRSIDHEIAHIIQRREGCRSLCPTRHSEVKADGSKTYQTRGA